MARKRYFDEDVLNLLRQIELSLASGSSIETPCRSAGISDATYYNMAFSLEMRCLIAASTSSACTKTSTHD